MTIPLGRLQAKHLRRGDVITDPYVPGVLLTVLSRKHWPDGTIDIRVALRPESGLVIREVQLHPDQRVAVCKYGNEPE